MNKAGYTLFVGNSDNSKEKQESYYRAFREKRVGGFLLIAADGAAFPDYLSHAMTTEVPMVLIDRYYPGVKVDTVLADNLRGAYETVSHMIACGHRRIGIVTGPLNLVNTRLNIGPKADGSVPEESVRVLTEVGKWMDKNGPTIYESEPCAAGGHVYASYTRKGNTLYMHIHNWPGQTLASNWLEFFNPSCVAAIGGLRAKVQSARLSASGKPVTFEQGDQYVRFTGLPLEAPDSPVTTLAIECDAELVVEGSDVRKFRKREGAGI